MVYLTGYLKKAIKEENEHSIKFLKKINKGIYLHIFNPNENVYEMRKNIPHIIESGTTVIKPVVEFIHDRSINIDNGYKIVFGEVWVFGKRLVDAMMTMNTYKKKDCARHVK